MPNNPYLLLKVHCHINIEVCNTVNSIKYLFKYFYKGPDTAIIRLNNSENTIEDHADITIRNTASESDSTTNKLKYEQIEQYVIMRYVCPPEAMYRIYKFKLHDQSHVISTAERNNVEFRGRLKNVVSRRADEEHRISPYTGHVLTVKLLRYDVVQPGAEIQRCFAQPSIYRLSVNLKDEQYIYIYIYIFQAWF